MFDYAGKTVFVAGGTSGINLGIAEAFAEAGANVFVFSRRPEKVEAAVAKLQNLGAKAEGAIADVRDVDAVTAAFARAAETFGEIDVLVSGAAGNFPARANDLSSNGFRAVMEIDLLGTHHVMTAAYQHLRKPGASIVNISAPQAVVAMTGQVHVCAAKAGVDMITKTLALEWGEEGIRINSVIPGPIDGTEGMSRLAPTPEAMEEVRKSVPMKRVGIPRDVANLCMYLGSDFASYLTGAVIPVDGGWALNMPGTALDPILDHIAASRRAKG
ncbi:SDR family oxidoreductase [Tepidamorphus sp. 3E244]|uniref:SDR family oxidoreductase n=1 Tax=Tepidamorphus sp. 3E244 TaxID=3385498 RepID=UPI0038FC71A8